jgi:WD40 repeat protein
MGRVIVWDLSKGKRLTTFGRFPFPVNSVAFAADGRHLATANGDGTFYVLRLKSKAE